MNVFNFISDNEFHLFMHHFLVRNELFDIILWDLIRCKFRNVVSAHFVFKHLFDRVYSRFQLQNDIFKLIHLVLKLLHCASFSPCTTSLEHRWSLNKRKSFACCLWASVSVHNWSHAFVITSTWSNCRPFANTTLTWGLAHTTSYNWLRFDRSTTS